MCPRGLNERNDVGASGKTSVKQTNILYLRQYLLSIRQPHYHNQPVHYKMKKYNKHLIRPSHFMRAIYTNTDNRLDRSKAVPLLQVFFVSLRKHTYIILTTPLKPHFYIVKLGLTGVYIFFLYFFTKT